MTAPSSLPHRLGELVEHASCLDPLADAANRAVAAIMPSGKTRSLLSGSWIGHPAHPFLVATPIGLWTTASVLDLVGQPDAARTTIAAGIVSSVPVVLTGASDWLDTAGAERRVGLVHAVVNLAALSTYTSSWWARRRGRTGAGIGLALAGAGIATLGGWLGGHLAYSLGVGVDTNAFESGPADWTDLPLPTEELGHQAHRCDVDGVALLVARRGDRVCVLADRCSHRGGPLSDGELRDGVVTCPWHGSRFDLASGEVVEGPASTAQPVYEVRSEGSRIQVRRREQRALRANVTRPE